MSAMGISERIAPTTGAAKVPPSKQDLYRQEADKWSLGGFTPTASVHVAPERIADCPIQVEARVRAINPTHGGAEAVATHAHEDLVIPGTSHIDLDRWHPLCYTFRHYFAQGDRVAVSHEAEQ
jgi:flavin reductase (DIM6/NTAB) family NADH-FMN oxidoreductase RutF